HHSTLSLHDALPIFDKEGALGIVATDGAHGSGVTRCKTTLGGISPGYREAAQRVIEFRLPTRTPTLEAEIPTHDHHEKRQHPPIDRKSTRLNSSHQI